MWRVQPIQFSHERHVAGNGIDCRYCHTTVETSSFAGIPTTKTCMNCHSQIFSDAAFLEPVRESFRTDRPIAWTRVHDLPAFAYFDHSIHVAKGVGCSTLMAREKCVEQSRAHCRWMVPDHKPRAVRTAGEEVHMNYWRGKQLEIGEGRGRESHRKCGLQHMSQTWKNLPGSRVLADVRKPGVQP